MDKTEKKPKLLKKFDDLNEAFTYPRLRISNVFQELCHQVDLKFAKKQQTESNPEVRSKTDENWNQMIQNIKDYEDVCLKKQSTNTFDNVFSKEITAAIEIIKQKVEHYKKLNDRALYSGIDDLIYDTLNRIDQVLFLNKTMFFLPKDYYELRKSSKDYYDPNSKIAYFACPHEYIDIFSQMDNETTVGKLVIINNVYCGPNATKLITNYRFYNPRISREVLICNKIKNYIEKHISNLQIEEIKYQLDNDCGLSFQRSFNEVEYLLDRNLKVYLDKNLFDQDGLLISYLNLTANYLECLEANIFSKLTNLVQLNLCHCNLNRIEQGTFNGLTNLKELALMGNELVSIDSNIFEGLFNVERIHMNGNKNLSRISRNLFKGLNKLRKIDMHNHNLSYIDLDMFKDLESFMCLVVTVDNQKQKLTINNIENLKTYKFDVCF